MRQKVLVIVGPTASGKSDLAVRLAKKFNGEVISADSRQVYKGLNIGSGKITKKEMRGVPHHLLDVADPKKQFSGSEYRNFGEKALRDILSRNRQPIVVGGTGFYIDILSCVINFPDVAPNKELRKKLSEKSVSELLKMLARKDPVRAKEVDPNNKLRIIRALEIVEVLGKVPRMKAARSPYEFVYVGLKPDKEVLEKKIYDRLIKRMPGMLREAKRLHSQGLTYKRMFELGLEYRYLSLYLQNKISKQKMVDELYKEIKRYAKRQMTYFRRNKKIMWFKPEEYKKIEKYLKGKL
ncbi:MAG: tRNA (adenosine(37)-N6)-dimethylallyltransferase MiaA [bacterium]|nr:tRNA (adenosine(37)-N6)-dimethylallyltransferase MiaA [bacterium]